MTAITQRDIHKAAWQAAYRVLVGLNLSEFERMRVANRIQRELQRFYERKNISRVSVRGLAEYLQHNSPSERGYSKSSIHRRLKSLRDRGLIAPKQLKPTRELMAITRCYDETTALIRALKAKY